MRETKIDKPFILTLTLIVGAIVMACLDIYGWGFVFLSAFFVDRDVTKG